MLDLLWGQNSSHWRGISLLFFSFSATELLLLLIKAVSKSTVAYYYAHTLQRHTDRGSPPRTQSQMGSFIGCGLKDCASTCWNLNVTLFLSDWGRRGRHGYRLCTFHDNETSVWLEGMMFEQRHAPPWPSSYHVSFRHVADIITFCFHSLLLGTSASLWLVKGIERVVQLGIVLPQSICLWGRNTTPHNVVAERLCINI